VLLDLPLIWLVDRLDIIEDIRLLIFSYTLGEALGALVFAPAIILFGKQYYLQYAYADLAALRTEKAVWLAAAAVLVLLTLIMGKYYFFAGLLDAELLLFPMIIWSALRLGVIFTNIAVAIISYTVFTFHFFGIAGTSGEMTPAQVLGMLLLIITLAIMGQLVAATTLERRKKELLLEQAALHDPITGLPNVVYLRKSMEAVNQVDQDSEVNYMLGYISICNYEALFQGYGIEARNALYCQFGHFLQLETASDIKIYRVSGPIFAILLEEKQAKPCIDVLHKLAEKVKHFNFIWEERAVHINAVFSLVPADYTPGELHGPLEHASALVEKAYQLGNIGTVIVDHKDQHRKHREVRADWLGIINEALAKDRFTLVAQPIVSIDKTSDANSALYFEVLLRLQSSDGRLEMPEKFIPYAESFNLMPSIDRWVIRHTLQWLSSIDMDIGKLGLCSINLSGQSVADPNLCSDIEQLLHEYKIPAKNICFEITETAAIADMYMANTFVSRLQKLGCSVALDDFGSGLSSFEYLKML
ncbi:MAG: EAL domain-containing protein, partial [Gammaproteobacteria bacterium]|nr:EAL domain-containing protein [Gammaproteobacteria bacterium]